MIRVVQAIAVLMAAMACAPDPVDVVYDGWDAQCPLEIVGTPSALPALSWRRCGEDCEVLTTADGRIIGQPRHRANRLVVTRRRGDHKELLVLSEDARIEYALRQPLAAVERCTFYVEDVERDALLLGVRGDGRASWKRSAVEGALRFDFATRSLEVVHRDATDDVSSYRFGAGVVRATSPGRVLERVGADIERLHIPAMDRDHLPIAGVSPVVIDDDLYFEVGARGHRAVMVHRAGAARAVPFARWPRASNRSAGNLGGDGHTLVWTETSSAGAWIVASRRLDGRRVRVTLALDPNPTLGSAPFVVARTRAAHWSPGGPIVVDLETGSTQRLPERIGGHTLGDTIGFDATGRVLVRGHGGAGGVVFRLLLGREPQAARAAPSTMPASRGDQRSPAPIGLASASSTRRA